MSRLRDQSARSATRRAAVVVGLLLAVALPTIAQQRKPRPVPTVPVGHPDPAPGGHNLNNLCDYPEQQPSISLSLSAEDVLPGDRVTLTWSVRPRVFRPGGSWGRDVALHADFTVDPPLPSNPVAASGSHTFTVPQRERQGNVTLGTLCGQKTAHFRVAGPPALDGVYPELGAPGAVVRLRGADFGNDQPNNLVELTVGRATMPMDLRSWSDDLIEVSVPDDAPRGVASIMVRKGGRLDSRPKPFRVLGSRLITNQLVQLAAGGLGLGQTAIRLHQGDNGCTVEFSNALNQAGVADTSFTGPRLVRAVGDAFADMVSAVLTAGFFPKRVYYELNDFNSKRVDIALDGADMTVEIGFESQGKELLGDLETCSVLFPSSCERVDNLAPDVDLDHAVVTIRARLGLADHRIQVTSIATAFDADFRIGGGGLDQNLIEAVTEFSQQRVTKEVTKGIDDAVDKPAVRRAIADAIMDQLDALGIRRLVTLTVVGHDLRVEYE